MCVTLVAILFQVEPKTTEDYQKLKENITKELEKTSPDDVPRVVISVASSLNFDNKIDSKSEQERKEVTKRIQYNLFTLFYTNMFYKNVAAVIANFSRIF